MAQLLPYAYPRYILVLQALGTSSELHERSGLSHRSCSFAISEPVGALGTARTLSAACESEQQHVAILVRNKGLSQLDTDNMWRSWYEIRACLNSIRITCGDPGTVLITVEKAKGWLDGPPLRWCT